MDALARGSYMWPHQPGEDPRSVVRAHPSLGQPVCPSTTASSVCFSPPPCLPSRSSIPPPSPPWPSLFFALSSFPKFPFSLSLCVFTAFSFSPSLLTSPSFLCCLFLLQCLLFFTVFVLQCQWRTLYASGHVKGYSPCCPPC